MLDVVCVHAGSAAAVQLADFVMEFHSLQHPATVLKGTLSTILGILR